MKRYSKVKATSVKGKSKAWATKVFILSICLSLAFGFLSQTLLAHVGVIVASICIVLFMMIGVVFDMLGIAVAGADEEVFAKWTQEGKKGANAGLKLCQSSEKVCSFCADVVGDICATLCGSAGACIVVSITHHAGLDLASTLSVCVSALIAGLTIFFKALMKSHALEHSNRIILRLGALIERVYKT